MGRLKTVPSRLRPASSRLPQAQHETTRTRGRAWLSIRNRILLRDHGMCQECRRQGRVKAAAEVDHRQPLHLGGTDDDANLESLCLTCHEVKTKAEDAARRGVSEGRGG